MVVSAVSSCLGWDAGVGMDDRGLDIRICQKEVKRGKNGGEWRSKGPLHKDNHWSGNQPKNRRVVQPIYQNVRFGYL